MRKSTILATGLILLAGCTSPEDRVKERIRNPEAPIVKSCEGEADRGYVKEGDFQYRQTIINGDTVYLFKNLEEARTFQKRK